MSVLCRYKWDDIKTLLNRESPKNPDITESAEAAPQSFPNSFKCDIFELGVSVKPLPTHVTHVRQGNLDLMHSASVNRAIKSIQSTHECLIDCLNIKYWTANRCRKHRLKVPVYSFSGT